MQVTNVNTEGMITEIADETKIGRATDNIDDILSHIGVGEMG